MPRAASTHPSGYMKIDFCSHDCAAMAHRKEHPSRTAIIARARKFRKMVCDECGGTNRLAIHHLDGNEESNAPENLKTLCCSCHIKAHEIWQFTSNWKVKEGGLKV